MKKSGIKYINSDRLSDRIKQMGEIGALPGGGVCRLALSDEDKSARDLLKEWMMSLELSIQIDEIGNMFGILPGEKNVPAIMIGSHLDTVTTGGLYDGSLGVLTALEVIEAIKEQKLKLPRPVILANFTNEEGVRFIPDMMGSLAFSKKAKASELHKSQSLNGEPATIKEELSRIGYDGTIECGSQKVKTFIEVHIEQGPILDSKEIDIGIVERVQGIYWTEYIFEGRASHAGTTPMNMRKDAGYIASLVSSFVRQLVLETGKNQVGTVGHMELFPNLINVCAEKARIIVDLRNPNLRILDETQSKLDRYIQSIVSQENIDFKRNEMVRVAPVDFNFETIKKIESVSNALEYSSKRMTSGAGHDAQLMASVCQSAMIFIPSKDGLSHNINEFSTAESIEKGANVLLNSVIELAH